MHKKRSRSSTGTRRFLSLGQDALVEREQGQLAGKELRLDPAYRNAGFAEAPEKVDCRNRLLQNCYRGRSGAALLIME